jgi:hypothetical protein
VNEEGVVYCKNMEGKPVERWPGKDPGKTGWKVFSE